MTSISTWKAFERTVASFFGSERTPLSGGNSKITRSDSLHNRLFIECKLRAKHSIIATWDDAKKKADIEHKIPVVCVREKGRKGFWILVHCEDMKEIVEEVR
jgi:hypothetical protein